MPLDLAPSAEEQAKRDLLAGANSDQTARATAFQDKYAKDGISARVGENGELSFSNVPGQDVYGPYMKVAAKTPDGRAAVEDLLKPQSQAGLEERAAATEALGPNGTIATITPEGTIATHVVQIPDVYNQPVNSDDLFKQQYSQMSQLTNVEDIVNARANIIQSTENWITTKHQNYKDKAENARNVAGLKAEVAKNEAADRQAYADFNNGVDLGDSDETLTAKAQYEQAVEKSRMEAARALDEDPEVKGAKARLAAIDGLTDARLKDSLSAATAGQKSESELAKLVLPEQVAATQTALGQDPSQPMDPTTEKALRMEIVSGKQGPLSQAMNVGLTADKNQVLINAMSPGSVGIYGNNVLDKQLDGNKELAGALKAETAKAIAATSGPQLDKNGKPLAVQPTVTKEEQQIKQRQAMVQAIATVKAQRDQTFETNVDKWQLPQDPQIQAEVKNTIGVMQAERQASHKDGVPDATLNYDGLVARMNLKKADGTLDTVKMRKVADWYASQASQVPGNAYFGPPNNALDPYGRVSAIAVSQQAIDRGLIGDIWDGTKAASKAVYSQAEMVVDAAVTSVYLPVATKLMGTGEPIPPPPAPGTGEASYNPAQWDVNYEVVTNYYRGRAGVDPAWIEERDKNIAALKGQ